jgi:isopentenyldiphosphate isomerase
MSEVFDIYDDGLNLIGSKPRDEVHRDGDWHQVFHCWVISRGCMILQKRAPNKKIYPNMLDISCGGHLSTGETVREGSRELHEELGLEFNFDDLISVGRRISMNLYNGLIDREIANVFLYEVDMALSDINYLRDEISGLVALPVDDGLALFSGEVESVTVDAVGFEQDQLSISLNDFVRSVDNIYYRAMILAKRYLNSEKHLLI